MAAQEKEAFFRRIRIIIHRCGRYYNYLIAEFVIAWIAKRTVKKAVDGV
jgi:hypothetical protein